MSHPLLKAILVAAIVVLFAPRSPGSEDASPSQNAKANRPEATKTQIAPSSPSPPKSKQAQPPESQNSSTAEEKKSGEPPAETPADPGYFSPLQANPFHNPAFGPSRKPRSPSMGPLKRDALGRYHLDWSVLAGTTINHDVVPQFPPSLKQADGKTVVVHGLLQPLDDMVAASEFLLVEYRADCLNCQVSDPTGLVLVVLKDGRRASAAYGRLTVQGTLRLNRDDPDDFLYIVTDSEIIDRQ